MLRVSVCSPDPLFGEALAALLERQGHWEVLSVDRTPTALLASAHRLKAQLLVVDSDAMNTDTAPFLAGVKSSGVFGMVSLIHESPGPFDATRTLRQVRRQDGASALVETLLELGGENRIDQTLKRAGRKTYGSREDGRLSRREFEVAQHVAKGLSNRRIANVTGLREQSVKNLVSVIMRKLDCDNRVQVALKLVSADVDQTSGSDG